MTVILIPLSFEGAAVRVVEMDGEPWFVARDIADVLGYSNVNDAIGRHCKGVVKRDLPTASGVQSFSVIPERDVYRLIMRSKLSAAERFEEWVVGMVLPSIRKSGFYSLGDAESVATTFRLPQTYPEALRALATAHEAHTQTKQVAHEQRAILEQQAPVVAAHERLAAASGSFGVREAAKMLKVANHAEFVEFLEIDIMYRSGKRRRLIAYKGHEDAKRLQVSSGITDGGEAWAQSRFTAKGLAWLAARWGEYQLDAQAYRARYAKAKPASQEAA